MSTWTACDPTTVVGKPSRSNQGASKLYRASRWSTVAASVFARPGREAQTCGPTYLIRGTPGSASFSALATRMVKPQLSISTTASGFSATARATVSATRRLTSP